MLRLFLKYITEEFSLGLNNFMKLALFLLHSGTEMLQRFWTNWLPFSGHRSTTYLPMLGLGRQRSLYSYSSSLYSQVGCCSFTVMSNSLWLHELQHSRLPYPSLSPTVYFPGISVGKNLPEVQKTWIQSLGWEDSLEKGMASHFSILAWRITWKKEPGWLHSPWGCKSRTWLND